MQVYQCLTRDYLSDRNDVYPAGVNFDPRSGALVVNGLPGHLQFYSLKQDAMLYNVSNTGATIYPIQVMCCALRLLLRNCSFCCGPAV